MWEFWQKKQGSTLKFIRLYLQAKAGEGQVKNSNCLPDRTSNFFQQFN